MEKRSPRWIIVIAAIVWHVQPNWAQSEWGSVQNILRNTRDNVVLDGTTSVPLRHDGTKSPQNGDWMVRHTLSDPENLNPYTSSDAGASRISAYIYESLLYAEEEAPFALKGLLAIDYPVISEDRLSYLFELRTDATFADGEPVTVQDVLFSMKVIKNPAVLAPHLRNYFSAVTDVIVEDGNGIRFVCDQPYFRNDLVLGSFEVIPRHFYDPDGLMDPVAIKSLIDGSWETREHAERVKKFAEQFNQNFNRQVLGSGPYSIENPDVDIVTQQKVVLTRNPKYWGASHDFLPSPGYIDKLVFKVINNMDAAFVELTNGNLDLHGLQPLEFKEKSWSKEFTGRFLKGIAYGSGYTYIGWNNSHTIFSDPLVRRAMTHLTDKEGMVTNLLFNLGEPVLSPIHKFRPEYHLELKTIPYDPDLALDLLEKVGWDDADGDGVLDKEIDGKRVPFKFEFLVNSGNQIRKDIALIMQHELADIGIVCEVRELDWSIFLQRVKNKDFAAVTLGWTGSLRFPPDGYQIWHSSQAEGNGSNFISFKNQEVDEILESYRKEFDFDKRVQLYKRFQEILHEDQPYTFLWKSRSATAYSRRFEGVNWYLAGPETREWWVDVPNQIYQ